MQGLTTKELGAIEECIKMEALAVRKLQAYEREASDPELREMCRSGVDTAQRHIEELLGLLR
jgi:rubrerythrin